MIFYGILVFFLVVTPSLSSEDYTTFKDVMQNPEAQQKQHRDKKFFQVFQIVTFPNDACYTGTQNGTCYTSGECTSKGGTGSGECANGFGVCCVFSKTCGEMTRENCTYFTRQGNTVDTTRACSLDVCPCGNNICQIRLDFETFTITGPSTQTDNVIGTNNGIPIRVTNAINKENFAFNSNRGQCLTDRFSVTSPGNNVPPTVCGNLQGEHMYVDLNDGCCDKLSFDFMAEGRGANLVTRSWNIKITQYSCDHPNLAPPGCTQYFYGQSAGVVSNYNFPNQHLANQEQQICFRRELGQCRICYIATQTLTAGASDFDLGGVNGAGRNTMDTICAAYGNDGLNAAMAYDHISIPFRTTLNVQGSQICGNGDVGTSATNSVCSIAMPFRFTFRTDAYEGLSTGDVVTATDEAQRVNTGFRINYVQDGTTCTF